MKSGSKKISKNPVLICLKLIIILRFFCKKRTELSKIEWKLRNFEHAYQSDNVNCGSFVCMFFEKLIMNDTRNNYLNLINPKENRLNIFDSFVKFNSQKNEKLIFCYICEKKEADQQNFKHFDCWHTYHDK